MARKEIQQALATLESSDTPLPVALDALDDLEDHLSLEDIETLRRLDHLARRSPGALAQAIERCGLRVRRENVDWDVLTTTSATGQGPPNVSRVLRQAKQALTEAAPFARVAFLQRSMTEEAFAVGTVLAVQVRVEKDAEVLAAMARALGRLGGPTSHQSLKLLVAHQSSEVRTGAVEALGYQRGSRALGLVVAALGDSDQAVRYQAMEVLESSPPRAVLEAIRYLPETSTGQIEAIHYLQGLGAYPGALALLLRRLDSPVTALAEEALVALAGLAHPEAEKRIQQLSVSRKPEDQQTFARAQRAWPQG